MVKNAVMELLAETNQFSRFWCLSWSPSGEEIAVGGHDGVVLVFRVVKGEGEGVEKEEGEMKLELAAVLEEDSPTSHSVSSVAWNHNGLKLAAGSFSSNSYIWGRGSVGAEWEPECELDMHENEVKGITFLPNSSNGEMLVSCSRDKTTAVHSQEDPGHFEGGLSMEGDARDSEPLEVFGVTMDHSSDVKFVSSHPSLPVYASGSFTGELLVHEVGDMDVMLAATLKGHTGTVWDANFSPDGMRLVSGSADGTTRIWEASTGLENAEVSEICIAGPTHHFPVRSVDWGSNGLVAGGIRGEVQFLSEDALNAVDRKASSKWRCHPSTRAHIGDLHCLRWSPTSPSTLATVGEDGVLRVWKVSV